MKAKKSVWIFAITILLFSSLASAISVSEVKTDAIGVNWTIISWKTDAAADSKVSYGKTKELGEKSEDKELVTEHKILLKKLTPETNYFFKAESSDKEGNKAGDDNNGNMHEFTTKKEDKEAPGIDVGDSFPESGKYFKTEIDVTGKTEPMTTIEIRVNGKLSRKDLVEFGDINFEAVRLDGGSAVNVVEIKAIDAAGLENTITETIELDLIAPEITVENIPELVNMTSVSLKGSASESVNAAVSISLNEQEPTKVLEKDLGGEFDEKIELNKGDGDYKILIEFTDTGGNKLTKEFKTTLDKTPPRFLSPSSLQEFSPTYVREVEIKGKVSEKAKLIVERKLADDKTYKTVKELETDDEGNFKFRVDLEREIGLGKEAVPTRPLPGAIQTGAELKKESRNDFRITAIDKVENKAKLEGSITYNAGCSIGGDWSIEISNIRPSSVPSEFVLRGIAGFGFDVQLTWTGAGKNPRLDKKIEIKPQDLSPADKENFNEKFFPNTGLVTVTPQVGLQGDRIKYHAFVNFGRPYRTDEDLRNATHAPLLGAPLQTEIRVPFVIEVSYRYDSPYAIPGGVTTLGGQTKQTVPWTQLQCGEARISIEHRIPEDKIPERFLNLTTSALDQLIESIDKVLGPIQTARTYTLYGCAASAGAYFINLFSQKFSCFQAGPKAIFDAGFAYETNYLNPALGCTEDKRVSDPQKCQQCVASIQTLLATEQAFQFVCDRIFCPAGKTIEYHARTFPRKDVVTGAGKSQCSAEIIGEIYTTTNLNDLRQKINYPGQFDIPGFTSDKVAACKKEYDRYYDSTCLLMDEWKAQTEPVPIPIAALNAAAGFCSPEQPDRITHVGGGDAQYLVAGEDVWVGTKEKNILEVTEETKLNEEDAYTKYFELEEGKKVFNTEGATRIRQGKDKKWYTVNEDGSLGEVYSGKEPPKLVQSKRKFTKQNFIIDPASSLINSVRCGCITGVESYLSLWRDTANVINQCFKTILITKQATAGVCKQVITQYACDLIIDGLSCFANKFYSEGAGTEVEAGSSVSKNMFKAFSGSVHDVRKSVSNRYGTTNLYRAFFVENNLLNAACYYAFTGNWPVDIDALVAESVRKVRETEAMVSLADRRFIDYNTDGFAAYVYHTGALLFAGPQTQYRLELVCSNDLSCEPSGALTGGGVTQTAGGQTRPATACDCWRQQGGQELAYPLPFGTGSAAAGAIVGSGPEGDIYMGPLYLPYRFDKVRLTYTFRDNKNVVQTKTAVRNIRTTGGEPPAECVFDVTLLQFKCTFEIGIHGQAAIQKVDAKDVYYLGEEISFDIDVNVKDPIEPEIPGAISAPKKKYAAIAFSDPSSDPNIPGSQLSGLPSTQSPVPIDSIGTIIGSSDKPEYAYDQYGNVQLDPQGNPIQLKLTTYNIKYPKGIIATQQMFGIPRGSEIYSDPRSPAFSSGGYMQPVLSPDSFCIQFLDKTTYKFGEYIAIQGQRPECAKTGKVKSEETAKLKYLEDKGYLDYELSSGGKIFVLVEPDKINPGDIINVKIGGVTTLIQDKTVQAQVKIFGSNLDGSPKIDAPLAVSDIKTFRMVNQIKTDAVKTEPKPKVEEVKKDVRITIEGNNVFRINEKTAIGVTVRTNHEKSVKVKVVENGQEKEKDAKLAVYKISYKIIGKYDKSEVVPDEELFKAGGREERTAEVTRYIEKIIDKAGEYLILITIETNDGKQYGELKPLVVSQ